MERKCYICKTNLDDDTCQSNCETCDISLCNKCFEDKEYGDKLIISHPYVTECIYCSHKAYVQYINKKFNEIRDYCIYTKNLNGKKIIEICKPIISS